MVAETSGGGIRTSLVCAAGFGKHGSLTVFSAGLRTEVGMVTIVPRRGGGGGCFGPEVKGLLG